MKISMDDVKHIAKLAKLRFSDEEVLKLAQEFEGILTYFQSIDKMNLDHVDLNMYSEKRESIVRPDSNTGYDDKAKLFQNAKSMRERYIQVPKIIE
jgi:aspartyl-tRNA(Asn)/glutamyl-tRNA(Gln) amidotransferase subunit C